MENKNLIGSIAVSLSIAAAGGALSWAGVTSVKAFKRAQQVVEVKGYAETKIVSDFAVWNGFFVARDTSMTEAYKKLEESKKKVEDFLTQQGITKEALFFQPARVEAQYKRDVNGINTNEIELYTAEISFKIEHTDTNLIDQLAKKSTDLIHQGVQLTSQQPSFFYSKLDEVKIALLSSAAKDAHQRAESLAKSGGSQMGYLKSIKQGVFQITPEFSSEVSDYGVHDTTTVKKSVKVVVNAAYYLKF